MDRLKITKVEAKAKVEAKTNPNFSFEYASFYVLPPNSWDYNTIKSGFKTISLISLTIW